MNIKTIANRAWAGAKIFARKNGPTCMIIGGSIGLVIAGVTAIIATRNATQAFDAVKENLADIRSQKPVAINGEPVKKEDEISYFKKSASVHIQEYWRVGKYYIVPASIAIISLASIGVGLGVIKKQYAAALSTSAELGRAYTDLKNEKVCSESDDDKNKSNDKFDPETTEKSKQFDPDVVLKCNPWAKIFDEGNPNFSGEDSNYFWLKQIQDWVNHRLQSQGHMFLNEVYDELDIPRTKAGQNLGWIYAPKDPNHYGKNFIDFGIFGIAGTGIDERKIAFINGHEAAILLDFNVDGVISDKVGTKI